MVTTIWSSCAPAGHLDGTVAADGVDGVGNQVQKNLLELRLIPGDNRHRFRQIHLDVDIVDAGMVFKNRDGLVEWCC
jgi:hypothetical protein